MENAAKGKRSMKLSIKSAVKRTFLYDVYSRVRESRKLREWQAAGKPVPPPQEMKQRTVKEYAARFGIHTLVETGTYLGDMIGACRNDFDTIFSLELDSSLCQLARQRFDSFGHISIIEGDSADLLPDILADIKDPCLFWLDGHYSEGITAKGNSQTPVRQELGLILKHPVAGHVILIDDARCFTGDNDYPTIQEVQEMVLASDCDRFFEVQDDIIRIHGNAAAWQPNTALAVDRRAARQA